MEVTIMQIKVCCYLLISVFLLLPTSSHARNCIKGKPCGNGCIAKQKTCRIDGLSNKGSSNSTNPRSVIRRTALRLPKVYQVNTESTYAREAPGSPVTTSYYKHGQRVFVYSIIDGWARISNMLPDEWLEITKLRPIESGTQ
jgi:hypothetical protein